MTLLANTNTAQVNERFEFWEEVHNAEFGPAVMRSAHARSFTGCMWRHELGCVRLHRVVADTSTFLRPPKLIGSGCHADLQLALVRRGCCVVSQNGNTSFIPEGEFTSYTTFQPLEVEALSPFELVLVTLPEILARPLLTRRARETALRFSGATGIARVVRSHVLEVLRSLDQGTIAADDTAVAESLIHLVRGLHGHPDPGAPGEDHTPPELLQRIRMYIELHLGDPGLSRDSIAREHCISVSYLDKLFHAADTSVWREIRRRRLDRCRRDLSDPRLAHRRILEIGTHWGFHNASHFTRSFTETYGMSPGAFRRSINGPAAADR